MAKQDKKQADIDQKIHQLITKIDQQPQKADNYLQLATYLLNEGSFAQATQLLEQAKQLVKKPQDLDYDLAVCYYMQGDFDKALTLLDQIPNDDLVLYQKALVYLKIGQKQKALAYALTIKKLDNRVRELLGDIWLSLGQLKEARTSYEQIPPAARSAKVNFLLGITVLEDDRKKAQEFLQTAKKLDPKYYQQALDQYSSILKLVKDKGNSND
ncbi:tetratricopeptide repeat protein [Lactobacillus sp. ESL0731]|uniref:tetratricopeptide repeat protein n=1 Tax=unclassified Lactobacillus TaxID=2620435 RepID=UPI0023F7C309|nr:MULTISPECIES: tetratricopeptide repeat protein [unclassified Lactobacillus]WEV51941.1 tetratricopeptide repeat protein [Lactobacillus sp. ESL0700]WEV63072.1 tetratricopeptide repeat protein [Lactobacillus sp. ESL0731]